MTQLLITLTVVTIVCCGCVAPIRDQPPTVGGQPVPNQNIVLDFTKRYDLVCRSVENSARVYQNCRIAGYTGETVRDSQGLISDKYYGTFGRWLVLELPDGRRAYVPGESIISFEDAKN